MVKTVSFKILKTIVFETRLLKTTVLVDRTYLINIEENQATISTNESNIASNTNCTEKGIRISVKKGVGVTLYQNFLYRCYFIPKLFMGVTLYRSPLYKSIKDLFRDHIRYYMRYHEIFLELCWDITVIQWNPKHIIPCKIWKDLKRQAVKSEIRKCIKN